MKWNDSIQRENECGGWIQTDIVLVSDLIKTLVLFISPILLPRPSALSPSPPDVQGPGSGQGRVRGPEEGRVSARCQFLWFLSRPLTPAPTPCSHSHPRHTVTRARPRHSYTRSLTDDRKINLRIFSINYILHTIELIMLGSWIERPLLMSS